MLIVLNLSQSHIISFSIVQLEPSLDKHIRISIIFGHDLQTPSHHVCVQKDCILVVTNMNEVCYLFLSNGPSRFPISKFNNFIRMRNFILIIKYSPHIP